MNAPGIFIFGLCLIAFGVTEFSFRKLLGNYAHARYVELGYKRLSKSPEYWATMTIAVAATISLVGVVCVINSFF